MFRTMILLASLVIGLGACIPTQNEALDRHGHTIVKGDTKKTVLITLGVPIKRKIYNNGEVGEIWHYCHSSGDYLFPYRINLALWLQDDRVIDIARDFAGDYDDCKDHLRDYTWEGKPVPPHIAGSRPESKDQPAPEPSSGSGFFVSRLGHIVTNAHVVDGCGKVIVLDHAGGQAAAEIVDSDSHNDLALLRLSTENAGTNKDDSAERKSGLRVVPVSGDGVLRGDDVSLGERVVVAGFPFGDVFSSTIKVTGGLVSATRGLANNTSQFQLDAAVQPGNSGGPIYDESGNIVGVVVSQLSKVKVAKATGALPENVNFGIKASTVSRFLAASGLTTRASRRSETLSTKDIARIGERQTVMVLCRGS